MSFTDEQKKLLAGKLDGAHVKKNPRGYSYVQGWLVIAEANRIFGFDGWSREMVELKCVSEKERGIGKDQDPGWGVTYTAKVRVTIDGIVRDGCGAGHGIDRDLGQAHESALKEAETDAMKRALMTFGNPFGLALYDKDQTNVERETPAPRQAPAPAPVMIQSGPMLKQVEDLKRQMKQCQTVDDLDQLRAQPEFKTIYLGLTQGLQAEIVKCGKDVRNALTTPALMAG